MTQLPRTEIIGFTLAGPAPLGEVHVPWRTGISVLYGANGSGKTTILRGIERSLSGRADAHGVAAESASAYVHVRLIDWDKPLIGDTHPDVSMSEVMWAGRDFNYSLGDELTRSIIDRFMGRIRRPRAMWDRTRVPREQASQLVQRIKSLDDGEVGPAPLELLEAFVALGEREPYLTFLATGTGDGAAESRQHAVFLGYSRGDGEGSEQREISLKYELLRVRAEHGLRAVPLEERTDVLIHDAAHRVFAEIEGEGVSMADVDADYAAICLSYLLDLDEDERVPNEFWIEYDGLGGKDDEGFPPLFAEAALAPTWVPVVSDAILLGGEFHGLPFAVSSSQSSLERFHRRSIQIHRSLAKTKNSTPEEVTEWVRDTQSNVEARANHIRRLLFPDLPQLSWRPGTAAEWIDGSPFVWEAIDGMTGRAIPVDQLSEAQQRWAGLVLALNAGGRDIVLIDEPELGLHQRAAVRTAHRLATFAEEEGIPVIVGSHSAGFLALEEAHPLHVLRRPGDGRTVVNPVDRSELVERAEALDLDIADLLQFVRTWIVVEGEHDRVLIDELIGQELRAAGAELVTMRGAKNLVTLADAQVLFKFTDASVILVLDAIDNVEAIQAMWTVATAAVRDGRPSEALGAVSAYRQSHRHPGYEERQLLAFAQQAIWITDPSRVRLFGFRAKDIIEYVPSDQFELEQDWAELRREYDEYKLNKGDFKNWLSLRKGARINVDSVQSGASHVRHEDIGEFTALLNMAVD